MKKESHNTERSGRGQPPVLCCIISCLIEEQATWWQFKGLWSLLRQRAWKELHSLHLQDWVARACFVSWQLLLHLSRIIYKVAKPETSQVCWHIANLVESCMFNALRTLTRLRVWLFRISAAVDIGHWWWLRSPGVVCNGVHLRGELCNGLGALRDGMLGQLSRQDKPDCCLDLPGCHSGLLGVASQRRGLIGNLLKDVIDKGVQNWHSLGADPSVRMNLQRSINISDSLSFKRAVTCSGTQTFQAPDDVHNLE